MYTDAQDLLVIDTPTSDFDNRVRVIEHLDQKILYLDVSNLGNSTDDIIQLMNRHFELTFEHRNTHVRHLMNGEGSIINNEIKNYGIDLMTTYKLYDIKVSSAISGITGVQKIIAKAIQPKLYFADDMNDALNWLATRP